MLRYMCGDIYRMTNSLLERFVKLEFMEKYNTPKKLVGLDVTKTDIYLPAEKIDVGYMTTRASLLSIIRILMSRRNVQQRIQDELDRVIGPYRKPLLSDREHCPYTEAVILETLRYISHIPLAPHYTTDDVEFRGMLIPKNCVILVNNWFIHHCEKEWENPFDFNPERFLDGDGNLLAATHSTRKRLAAFGYGKRSCVGEVLAKSRLFLFVANLMLSYSVVPPDGQKSPLFHPKEMKPGFILQQTEYTCTFVQR